LPSRTWTVVATPVGVCHPVRAPGVKWTLLAFTREAFDGVATVST
jgi:hypothetical protein